MAERKISLSIESVTKALSQTGIHNLTISVRSVPLSTEDVQRLKYLAQLEDGNVLLGRSNKAEAIRNIKRMASPSAYSPMDIMNIAEELPRDRYPVGAILLHWITFDDLQRLELFEALLMLHRLISDLEHVIRCLREYRYVVSREKRRALVDSSGIALFEKVRRWLQLLPRRNDVILCQAKCLAVLCCISNEFGQSDAAVTYGTEGVEIFRQYQGNPKHGSYFGVLHYEIGLAYFSMGKFSCSLQSYTVAVEAFKSASDMHEDEKTAWHRKTQAAKERVNRDGSNPGYGRIVPSETVTKTIFNESSIEVGGCILYFPKSAFATPQTLTITATIDSRRWPSVRSVITPTICIEQTNLKRPVTLMLPTWCIKPLGDEEQVVEVLRCNDDTDSWEIIETMPFNGEEFIEFKCQKFSSVVVAFREFVLYWAGLKPVVYTSRSDFVVALALNAELCTTSLLKEMRERLGQNVEPRAFQVQKSHASQVFHSFLGCQEYDIKPYGPYEHSVFDILTTGEASIKWCHMTITQKHTVELAIEYKLTTEGLMIQEHCFGHVWTPIIEAQDEDFDASRGAEHSDPSRRSEKSPPVQIVGMRDVNIDIFSQGRKTNYDGANLQTVVEGGMMTSSKNCSSNLKVKKTN